MSWHNQPIDALRCLVKQAFAHKSMSGLETRRGSDPFDTRAAGQEVLKCAVMWTFSWTVAQWGACLFNSHRLRSSKAEGHLYPVTCMAVLTHLFPMACVCVGGGRGQTQMAYLHFSVWARACVSLPESGNLSPSAISHWVPLATEGASPWPAWGGLVLILRVCTDWDSDADTHLQEYEHCPCVIMTTTTQVNIISNSHARAQSKFIQDHLYN